MDDVFRIYIDRLRDGSKQVCEGECVPTFLDVDEQELRFVDKVQYRLEANLAEDELVLAITVRAVADIPCSICNKFTSVPLEVQGVYHAVPVAEIKGAVYDGAEIVREMLLLELPHVTECGGSCSGRKEIEQYLQSSDSSKSNEYRPFEELDSLGS